MNIFRNAVFTAALAGLLAGIVMTFMQAGYTVPLILQAETFEGAAPAHSHAATAPEAAEPAADDHAAAGHSHDGEAWAPADGFERLAYTALANIVTGIGFALLLVAVSEAAGGIAGWRQGLIWGFAGFAVFTLAPGLGLPPELPAMQAAELAARQVWWVGTVVATAAGLALIAFRAAPLWALIGVVLIVAPHIVGAPQPVSHETPVPAELHHRFVVAVTITNLVFWLLLGVAVALVRKRFALAPSTRQQRSLA
ncbi:CbtA family protein [Nitratireductor pacificus]|uniref:Cobalt transporter subunit CbtA n=1 Tax=Nitratireductor pacificus pht-3B TaxID=391937 RepID=K2MPU7_9HYPH|nr:CbtA family protein [Nitratireductor pacificus]EKF19362.1 cobalt transporter subunit CbtA [Nitratireductor pacificus pht-3B]